MNILDSDAKLHKCANCGERLNPGFNHPQCDPCFVYLQRQSWRDEELFVEDTEE